MWKIIFQLQRKNPEKLKDKLSYLKFTREIHFSIYLMTHSEIIKSQTLKIWNLTDFYMLKSFDYLMTEPKVSIECHDEIIYYIKQREPQKASEKMREFTLTFVRNLEEKLP